MVRRIVVALTRADEAWPQSRPYVHSLDNTVTGRGGDARLAGVDLGRPSPLAPLLLIVAGIGVAVAAVTCSRLLAALALALAEALTGGDEE